MSCNNLTHKEKYGMLNDDQKFLNLILDRQGLEIKWLSDRLNMDYELVRYQLREAVNYRQDFHQRCLDVLKKEGFISSNREVCETNREVCEKLKDDLIDFSSVLSGTISIITKSIKSKISDRVLSEFEKKDLSDQIRNNLRRVTDEFNDLLLTIDMK